MPPKVLQKQHNNSNNNNNNNNNNNSNNHNSERASGVLPIPASARVPVVPKQPAARLKLEIRRLPPGLTLTEFEQILGDEWKLGAGKVDWREYRQGKLKSPGKLPEQSRCYVHVLNDGLIKDFEQRFLAIVFHDKAGTHKHAELKNLPPTLGFAPNQRVPVPGKQRQDNRQGTIDQDAEFIAFLEAETQPIPRPAAIDVQSAEKETAVKSTPLIEDLRERKANKAKAAAAKAEKKGHNRTESKDVAAESKGAPVPAAGGRKGDKAKVEQAAKEAAKVLNKQAAGKQAQNAAATAAGNASATLASQKGTASPAKGRKGAPQQSPKSTAATPVAPPSPAPQRGPPQRQRGNAEGIKKMLQKDLGIKPKAIPANQPAAAATSAKATPATTASTSKNTPNNSQAASSAPSTPAPTASANSLKAYLKHANPSQGMTEILIQRALAAFGEMGNVTIDPRKGTAIAVFKTQEGLKKAIETKKVTVANGAVEVMEFRDRGQGGGHGGGGGTSGGGGAGGGGGGGGRGGFRGGRGGGRGGRGGGNAAPAPPAAPAPAPAAP